MLNIIGRAFIIFFVIIAFMFLTFAAIYGAIVLVCVLPEPYDAAQKIKSKRRGNDRI